LEIVYTPKGYRGFKSLLLRQKEIPIRMDGDFFLMERADLKGR